MHTRIFIASAAALLVACSEQAHPPQIVPQGVSVVRIDDKGVDIETTLDAHNPNGVELTATGVQTKIVIGGKADVATARIVQTLVLSPKARTKPTIDIRVEWKDEAALDALAAAKQPAPYEVDGVAEFAARGIRVNAPFKIQGVMTPEELAKAAGASHASKK